MKPFRLLFATLAALTAIAGACAAENPSALLARYEKVSAALVADNFGAAQAAARQLAAEAAGLHQDHLAAAARAVAKADDLAAARTAFKTLSREAVALARGQKGWFIVNCPMADADWVQSTREIANPYFGQAMSRCGTITEETKG